jgi:hypothetical protein
MRDPEALVDHRRARRSAVSGECGLERRGRKLLDGEAELMRGARVAVVGRYKW